MQVKGMESKERPFLPCVKIIPEPREMRNTAR